MQRFVMVGLVVMTAACLESGGELCSDGTVCAAGRVCDEQNGGCVLPAQLSLCDGAADRGECALPGGAPGLCRNRVCLRKGCGDGFAMAGEQCDGVDLGGAADCADVGYHEGGALACSADCTYDVTACRGGLCGDGVVNGPEECDGADLGASLDCQSLGFYDAAPLVCDSSCAYDRTRCTGSCGDGLVNGGELCDGSSPAAGCVGFGYDAGYLPCSGSCAPIFSECRRIGWFETRIPSALEVWDIDGLSATEVWAVGRTDGNTRGFVARWDGTSWKVMKIDPYIVQSVWVRAPDDVFISTERSISRFDGNGWTTTQATWVNDRFLVGIAADDVYAFCDRQGANLHWDGEAWTPVEGLAASDPYAGWASGKNDVYVARDDGLTRWNGEGWSEVDLNGWVYGVTGVWGSGPNDVFAVYDQYVAHWNGEGWTQTEPIPELGVFRAFLFVAGAGADVYAFVTNTGLAHFDGMRWALPGNPAPTQWRPRAIWVAPTGEPFVGGETPGSVFQGAQSGWVPTPAPGQVLDLAARSPVEAYALLDETGNTLVRRFDGWQWVVEHDPAGSLRRISVGANEIWATMGGNPELLRKNGGGWSTVDVPGTHDAQAVWASPTGEVFVAAGAEVLRYSGGQWSQAPMPQAVRAVWGRSATDVYAVGDGISHFDGLGWTPMESPVALTLAAVWGPEDGPVFAVGEAGAVLRLEAGVWTRMDGATSADLRAVHGRSAGDVFAAGAGTIVHFDGEHWSQVASDPAAGHVALFTTGDTTFFPALASRLVRTLPW